MLGEAFPTADHPPERILMGGEARGSPGMTRDGCFPRSRHPGTPDQRGKPPDQPMGPLPKRDGPWESGWQVSLGESGESSGDLASLGEVLISPGESSGEFSGESGECSGESGECSGELGELWVSWVNVRSGELGECSGELGEFRASRANVRVSFGRAGRMFG